MPLIILTGYPCSGKTYRAQQLVSLLSAKISTLNEPPPLGATQPSLETSSPAPLPSPALANTSTKKAPYTIHHIPPFLPTSRNQIYSSARLEKDSRAAEYSAIKRALGRDKIVIADSGNYIKGYRYQLWCEAKAAGTTCCVAHVGTSVEQCQANNERRLQRRKRKEEEAAARQEQSTAISTSVPTNTGEGGADYPKTQPSAAPPEPSEPELESEEDDSSEPYNPPVLSDLIARYEEPSPMSRWDSPLFTILHTDALPPIDSIWNALIGAPGTQKIIKPHAATVLTPATSADALYELDRKTQEVVARVVEWAKERGGNGQGGEVGIPGLEDRVVVPPGAVVGLPRLQRLRRQFVNLNRASVGQGNGVWDVRRSGEAFVRFLNDQLEGG